MSSLLSAENAIHGDGILGKHSPVPVQFLDLALFLLSSEGLSNFSKPLSISLSYWTDPVFITSMLFN